MTSEERRQARYERRQIKRAINKSIRDYGHDDFDEVFTYKNLYNAYRKCRQNVSWKASTQKFIAQAPLNVLKIYDQLKAGKWKSSGFFEFDINERGKTRHIKSVTMEERVVQRCLCDHALVPVIKPSLIYDNGASTKGKGYHFSLNRCEKHLHDHYRKHGQDGYILLFDFSKFFDSVSHTLCRQITEKCFTDPKLQALIMHFIDAFGDRGLGLGSQISQTFALAAADRLGHYIKEVLRIKGYGRYMDDGYLIHHSKAYLQQCFIQIQKICDELGITLNKRKTCIVKLSHGFTFLKCRFYLLPSGKVVRKIYKRSTTKMRQKLKKFRGMLTDGRLTMLDVYQSFQSWRSYAKHFDAYYTIEAMTSLYNQLFIAHQ